MSLYGSEERGKGVSCERGACVYVKGCDITVIYTSFDSYTSFDTLLTIGVILNLTPYNLTGDFSCI